MQNPKDIDEFLLESGIIFITGKIKADLYYEIAQKLRYYIYLNKSPIRIYINSYGGEVESALAIIDDFKLFERKDKEIYTIGVGEICSSAAFILGYGTKRFITENAACLLHPISYDLGESEHQSTKSYVAFADKYYNNIMASLALRCGRKTDKDIKKFISDVRDGKWLDADQAIEFGLVDQKWDYSLE